MNRRFAMTAIAFAAVMGTPFAGAAQSVEEFYKGKNVELYIGYSVGGGYDIYARTLARHMGKHIPGNPTVVPVNMDGAGSLRLVNWLYQAAPKDGTVFGTFARAAPFDPLFGNEEAQFDALQFNYVGSANNEVSICAAMARTGIDEFDDIKTRTDHRRHRRHRRYRAVPEGDQRCVRHQDENHQRLSRWERRCGGDGAGRVGRSLRLVLQLNHLDAG
ncbi:MAG: hypothetical protein ACK4GC_01145 [Paracoccaceae bacterium]